MMIHLSFITHISVIDSWGKGEDGYIYGSSQYRGFIDECFDVSAPWPEEVTPKFCLIEYG